MFRAGLILIRRLITAASLLLLLVCGAEVGVRIYEASTGDRVCTASRAGNCVDTSGLTIPSLSFFYELKPMTSAQVECRDSDALVDVNINSHGLRGPELEIPKPVEIYRIVVLGDETIYAPETPESEHFCSLLEESLQARLPHTARTRIQVVNAGIPGQCPLTEFLLFKQRLLGLQPDLVILHFDWSDVADDRQIRRGTRCDEDGIPQLCPHSSLVASKKVRPHEVWRETFRLIDWGLTYFSTEWKQQIAQQKAVSRDVDTNPYAWLREEHPENNLAFRQSARPVADLAQLCRSSHLPFVLMTSPKPWQVSARCSRGAGVRLAAGVAQDACFSNHTPFDQLARFADRMNLPFADGSMVLVSGADAETNFLKHAPRWSPTGHQKMADLAANCLVEKVDGPWNGPYLRDHEQPISRDVPREFPIQRISELKSTSDSPVRREARELR